MSIKTTETAGEEGGYPRFLLAVRVVNESELPRDGPERKRSRLPRVGGLLLEHLGERCLALLLQAPALGLNPKS